MNPANDGEWFRGESISFAASGKLNFKTDFLSKARNLDAPCIGEFAFQFEGSVGGVTATALGIDAPKLFSRLVIRDKGPRCDVSGAMLYAHNEAEFGVLARGQLPATVASGATNTTYSYFMSVPFDFQWGSLRVSDYRIPVPYILEGGVIQCNLAAAVPTGWAAVQSDWKVTVWARVVDERVRELKSNLNYEQFSMTKIEEYFPILGSIRSLVASTELTTTDYTSWATYTTVNSKNLDLESDMDPRLWIHRAAYNKPMDSTTNNLITARKSIGIVTSDPRQKIGAMPMADQLDLRWQAAPPTSAQLIAAKIDSRHPGLAAAWMGQESPQALAAAIDAYGYVVDEHNTRANLYDAILASKLPIRLKPSAGA